MKPEKLSNPVVRRVVVAMRDGDREAFLAAFHPTAELTDDGDPQPLAAWADREIFTARGRLEVEREEDDGLSLTGRFRSDRWDMRTYWRFQVSGGLVRRLDVGAL